jgi:hypothetical protein
MTSKRQGSIFTWLSPTRTSTERRTQIVGLLAEGSSLRVASRLADVSINPVTKLLEDVGAACEEYQDRTLRGLKCKRIQCDEIRAFICAKAKNVPENMRGAWGVGRGRRVDVDGD